jgi:hypothetical protein
VQIQIVATPDSKQLLTAGQLIQIDNELMTILSALSVNSVTNTTTFQVLRGSNLDPLHQTVAPHNALAAVLPLDTTLIEIPFAMGFFENQAEGNFLHTISLPDVRIATAELFMTNRFGPSQAGTPVTPYTKLPAPPRTLSGGQFSLQVSGYMATQQNAAPALFVQATHAVRDIRAILNEAPNGFDVVVTVNQTINQVVSPYATLLVQSGKTSSSVLLGFDPTTDVQLPPLKAESMLTLDIALNPSITAISPGRDLTITIRF